MVSLPAASFGWWRPHFWRLAHMEKRLSPFKRHLASCAVPPCAVDAHRLADKRGFATRSSVASIFRSELVRAGELARQGPGDMTASDVREALVMFEELPALMLPPEQSSVV